MITISSNASKTPITLMMTGMVELAKKDSVKRNVIDTLARSNKMYDMVQDSIVAKDSIPK